MAEKYDIVAATGCPTGIAHTFMAKEALEKASASTTTDQTMRRSYSSAPMSPKHGFATTKSGCLWNCKLPHPARHGFAVRGDA